MSFVFLESLLRLYVHTWLNGLQIWDWSILPDTLKIEASSTWYIIIGVFWSEKKFVGIEPFHQFMGTLVRETTTGTK